MMSFMNEQKPIVGFIGQGFIGKNYADDLESRGYEVIRYALEEPYRINKERIKECDIVFVAVPTPTIPSGTLRDDGHPHVRFDDHIVRGAVGLVPDGAIVVIKSTLLPGTTSSIQTQYPHKFVMYFPEFLTETNAAHDATHPVRNIIGIPIENDEYRAKAEQVLALLPEAPFVKICNAQTAEHIKYANNAFLFLKIVFANIFYELASKNGADWETIREVIGADPRIGPSHLGLHLEGDAPNVMRRRGAGRGCFIKDFGVLSELYEATFPEDKDGIAALRGFEYKNNEFLREYDRYVNLLEGVYGPGTGTKVPVKSDLNLLSDLKSVTTARS